MNKQNKDILIEKLMFELEVWKKSYWLLANVYLIIFLIVIAIITK